MVRTRQESNCWCTRAAPVPGCTNNNNARRACLLSSLQCLLTLSVRTACWHLLALFFGIESLALVRLKDALVSDAGLLIALHLRAVSDRLNWAANEVLGGKDAFAVMVCSLVSAAVSGRLLEHCEREEFSRLARGVVQHVLNHGKTRLANDVAVQGQACGSFEVMLSLAGALQELDVQ